MSAATRSSAQGQPRAAPRIAGGPLVAAPHGVDSGCVIHEVDEALRRLVRDDALRGTEVEVAFDAPTKDWAARRNAPTVNVYLYDIREDLRRRQRGLLNE